MNPPGHLDRDLIVTRPVVRLRWRAEPSQPPQERVVILAAKRQLRELSLASDVDQAGRFELSNMMGDRCSTDVTGLFEAATRERQFGFRNLGQDREPTRIGERPRDRNELTVAERIKRLCRRGTSM